MIVLLITLLLTNLVVLIEVFRWGFLVNFLQKQMGEQASLSLGSIGTKCLIVTTMLILNTLYLIVGGIALLLS